MQARKPGIQVHRGCEPERRGELLTRAPCGNARGRQCGKILAAHAARKPRPPAIAQYGASAKTRYAFKTRHRNAVKRALLGEIQVSDHDDELVHERVF